MVDLGCHTILWLHVTNILTWFERGAQVTIVQVQGLRCDQSHTMRYSMRKDRTELESKPAAYFLFSSWLSESIYVRRYIEDVYCMELSRSISTRTGRSPHSYISFSSQDHKTTQVVRSLSKCRWKIKGDQAATRTDQTDKWRSQQYRRSAISIVQSTRINVRRLTCVNPTPIQYLHLLRPLQEAQASTADGERKINNTVWSTPSVSRQVRAHGMSKITMEKRGEWLLHCHVISWRRQLMWVHLSLGTIWHGYTVDPEVNNLDKDVTKTAFFIGTRCHTWVKEVGL